MCAALGITPLAHHSRPEPADPPILTPYSKVLVIVEENKQYDQIIGSPKAPYLNELASTYGSATNLDAGYPTRCTSLAGYLLLTSGDRQQVCDNKPPAAHPLGGDSVFGQVAHAGRQWRTYAESMPTPCKLEPAGRYAVKHTPAAYYTDIRDQCIRWQVPMGTLDGGAFHDDLTAATLPAYSNLIPDLCHDMHGDPLCRAGTDDSDGDPGGGHAGNGREPMPDPIVAGDAWLRQVMQAVLASPDYRANRLVVLITWDEGSAISNHIPSVVVSPSTRHVVLDEPLTHCSMLALVEDVLALPRLHCALGEPRRAAAFRLGI